MGWTPLGFSSSRVSPQEEFPHILGLYLGMDKTVVLQRLRELGLTVLDLAQPIPCPSLSAPSGVDSVRLFFRDNTLWKMVLYFTIPSPQSNAEHLLRIYEDEKARLSQRLGSPSHLEVRAKSPTPQHRYEWIARGRDYYRTVWYKEGMTVSLWLYGEDEGVVLMEMYELVEGP